MKKQSWKKSRKIYWHDELTDDFDKVGLKRPPVPDNYQYIRKNPIGIFFSNVFYFGIAKPILRIYCFLHGMRVKGKKNLKNIKFGFIYANHVALSDPFKYQVFASNTHRVYIIGYSDILSVPFVRKVVKSLGYLPLPLQNDYNNLRKLNEAIGYYTNKKSGFVVVYPEAHIWPYYTKIRNFDRNTVVYPVLHNAPIVPAVTLWKKRMFFKKPRQVIKFGKPIYPLAGESIEKKKKETYQELLRALNELANSEPQYEYIKYIKETKETKKGARHGK